MNPLTFLPLLAAVAVAAPGVLLGQPLAYNVPLTQTIHYQNQPVVTGYQQTILKPALAHAPLVSGIAFARQIPDLPTNPAPPADVPGLPANSTQPPSDLPTGPPADLPGGGGPPADLPTPAPPADLPTPSPLPTNPGGGENNGTESDQSGGIPTVPGVPGVLLNHANLYQVVNPIQLSAVAAPVQVAAVRAAQAGDFEPLVTKERVLAPVRTHTQITPQYTQIQPEIQVRRVVQDVPVIQPVYANNWALQGAQIIAA